MIFLTATLSDIMYALFITLKPFGAIEPWIHITNCAQNICVRIFASVVLIMCNRDTTQLYPSDLTSHIQKISEWWNFSNSHGKCSMKKAVLKNSEKFTGKHQYQSLFSNKVEGLRPATLLKKSLWHRCSCEFCEIWKSTFFTEHLWTTASEISVYSES